MMESYKSIFANLDYGTTESIFMLELIDNKAGLTITLSEAKTDKKIKVYFPPVYSYRNTNESYRLKTISNFKGALPNLVSEVYGSLFLDWFHKESQGIYTDNDIKHYLIFTGEEFIDVLSHIQPEITLDAQI